MSSTEHTMPDANRLYIGEGVTIKGEISVPDTLVVCGSLEGDVSVGNLVVGETGAIKGRITVAENAEISGKVFEKLEVKCLLILRSTGRVDGNISYGLLQIEQGASIAGGLSSTEYRPEQKPAKVDLYPRQDQKAGSKSGYFPAFETAWPDRFGAAAYSGCAPDQLSSRISPKVCGVRFPDACEHYAYNRSRSRARLHRAGCGDELCARLPVCVRAPSAPWRTAAWPD